MREYMVKNLDCAECAAEIEYSLKKMKETRFVSINFATSKILLDADNADELLLKLRSVHPDVSFEEISSKRTNEVRQSKEKSRLFAALILISILLYCVGIIFEKPLSGTPFSWAEYAVFLLVYFLAGHRVLLAAFKNLIHGRVFDENFLMSIATAGAIAIHALPEAAGVMIFYRIGMFLQAVSLARSRRSIASLLALKPDYANLVSGGSVKEVSPEEVEVGGIILVKPGERIPLDGIVSEGESQVDTSALSGEPRPHKKRKGDAVLAGMVNRTGTISVEVTRTLEESYVSKVLHITEYAIHKKARTEQFITRFAKFYTPIVISLAVLIALIPPLVISGVSFSDSVYRALVLLVISCPCALVLSIPICYYGGIGKASREGILVKGSNYLDALVRVKNVVFDKTGTITKGSFKVQDIVPRNGFTRDEVLSLAVQAESHSSHPIATSLFEHFGAVPDPASVKTCMESGGEGVVAIVEDRHVMVGNDKMLHREGIEHDCCEIPGTVVHVVRDGTYVGYIVISDEIKDDALKGISELKKAGVSRIHLLTGDTKASAEYTASSLGIEAYYYGLLPDEKVKKLEEIMSESKKGDMTAFVGDGINDAPAIARADVGIAMGELGSDAAIDTSDIVLATDSPLKVSQAIRIAKKTRRIVWENIVFALTVKLAFLVLGGTGISGMWEALFADMGVSLLAIFNAMRILR